MSNPENQTSNPSADELLKTLFPEGSFIFDPTLNLTEEEKLALTEDNLGTRTIKEQNRKYIANVKKLQKAKLLLKKQRIECAKVKLELEQATEKFLKMIDNDYKPHSRKLSLDELNKLLEVINSSDATTKPNRKRKRS